MTRILHILGLSAVAALSHAPTQSRAQDAFPSRTVKFVVPSVAGSTTDTLARVVAEQLGTRWGKPTIVENIAGGGMNIGARAVARAAPDGHTLLVAPPLPLSFSHVLYREPGYDPTQMVPITLLAKIPNVLVVRKSLPASTLKEMIDYGRANPGKLTYASAGAGSTAHLSAAQIEARTGIKMVHVPYRGAQPALTDVIGGHVDMYFETLATSMPLYRDNQVKLLGIADLNRSPAIPDVPTIDEAALPGFRSITWFGIVAPPATPSALAERLNKDTVAVLNSPEVSARLNSMSLQIGATTPSDTAKFFAEEGALWSKVIKEAGVEQQ